LLKLGSVIAWGMIAFGMLRLGMGFMVACVFDGPENAAAAARYLSTTNSGEAIDKALPVIFMGVALGVLVRIAENTEYPDEDTEYPDDDDG
jgi:hypothetical protein